MKTQTPPCILSAWETNEEPLRYWLAHQLAESELATDVLHDIFLKAVSQGMAFCEIDNPKAWLFQVARNHLVDLYRKDKYFFRLADSEQSGLVSEETDDKAVVDDLTQCLPRVLSELSDDDCDIIRRCDIQGLSLQQYATENQLTLPATKSRIQRARKRLREQMISKCQVKTDDSGAVCWFIPRSSDPE